MFEQTPIAVLTGFLGSGKTTLLNALLTQREFRDSAVVINEVGEIGLDHLLVASPADNIMLLKSGCLCCTLLGSLQETLADLYHRRKRGEIPPFHRVIVETSGLAEPGPVLRSIIRDEFFAHIFRFEGLICTIDARLGLEQLDEHSEAVEQAAVADRILITKTDMTDGYCPPDLASRIRAINPFAQIMTVSRGAIDASELLQRNSGLDELPGWAATFADLEHDHQDHHHSQDIESVSFAMDHPVTRSSIDLWIDTVRPRYGRNLLRCKGIFNVAGKTPLLLHGVQTVFEISELNSWPSEDRRTRLICIGRGFASDFKAFSERVLVSGSVGIS